MIPAAHTAARFFRPTAPIARTFTRGFRPAVVAAAAAPQLKEIDHSDIANKVKRQLLINGKFVDAIGGMFQKQHHLAKANWLALLPEAPCGTFICSSKRVS